MRKKILALLTLLSAALLALGGVTFIVIYVKDAIILRLGEADQWPILLYLPFLFVGISGLVCALVFGQAGLRWLCPETDAKYCEKKAEKKE